MGGIGGVAIPENIDEEFYSQQRIVSEILEIATAFYQLNLILGFHPRGHSVLKYLEARGIEKTSIQVAGRPIQVDERTLIPIITLSTFSSRLGTSGSPQKPRFIGFLVTPQAFVVVDPQGERALPIQEKDISLSHLVEDTPGLSDKIKEARVTNSCVIT